MLNITVCKHDNWLTLYCLWKDPASTCRHNNRQNKGRRQSRAKRPQLPDVRTCSGALKSPKILYFKNMLWKCYTAKNTPVLPIQIINDIVYCRADWPYSFFYKIQITRITASVDKTGWQVYNQCQWHRWLIFAPLRSLTLVHGIPTLL